MGIWRHRRKKLTTTFEILWVTLQKIKIWVLTTVWFIRSYQWSNMTPACQPGRKCKKLWEPQDPPQHQDQVGYLTLCTSGVKEFLQILWKILRVIWRRGKIVEQWRFTEGVWIPKEGGSKLLDQFRLISLLNIESKIFFSLLSRRLSDFFLGNGYVDASVQKGGVAGMPGRLEHTGVLTQLLREAKENKGDLTVLWLDLA